MSLDMVDLLTNAMLGIIVAATPYMLAATGELVVERSGVLNLGVEGMMIVGAVTSYIVAFSTGSLVLGVLVGILAGAFLSLCFAFWTQTLLTNQVATGLAVTLAGIGIAGLAGRNFVGTTISPIPQLYIPYLSDIPLIGKVLFGLDPIAYFSFILIFLVIWFLWKTRAGLILRAVGDSHDSAHALGYPVVKIRYMAILFGGACAGLAGTYLTLVHTAFWAPGMTAQRGWTALALVVFASWLPWRVVLGAYLFGTVGYMQLFSQGMGVPIPSQFLSSLPYLMTIVVLVLISRDQFRAKANTPASLGKVFKPDL
jgi:general nucleoside transport system permease protein